MSKIVVVETGGKQYIVSEGTVLTVELLHEGTSVGAGATRSKDSKFIFDKVLLIDDGSDTKIGAPYIEGAKVGAELIEDGRGPKLIAARYRPKSRYFVRKGHRQHFTKVKITTLP